MKKYVIYDKNTYANEEELRKSTTTDTECNYYLVENLYDLKYITAVIFDHWHEMGDFVEEISILTQDMTFEQLVKVLDGSMWGVMEFIDEED